jgi:hypothetical protein
VTLREAFFSPRGFLIFGGAVLLVIGILGFFIMKDSSATFFWMDTGEDIAHTAIGAFCLAAVYLPGLNTRLKPSYRSIVLLLGVIALFSSVYGFLLPGGTAANPNALGVSNIELGDNLLHLAFAIWAFLAVYWGPRRPSTGR